MSPMRYRMLVALTAEMRRRILYDRHFPKQWMNKSWRWSLTERSCGIRLWGSASKSSSGSKQRLDPTRSLG